MNTAAEVAGRELPGHSAEVEALRAEFRSEVASSRRVAWSLRALALAFAVAYLTTIVGLRQLDPFYLWLTAGTLLSGASQFVFIERYRVPGVLTRLATRPTPQLRRAVEALWPEFRASCGRDLAALGPRLLAADEIAALTLDEALAFLRPADRRDWSGFARAWAAALVLVLGAIAVACALHVPTG